MRVLPGRFRDVRRGMPPWLLALLVALGCSTILAPASSGAARRSARSDNPLELPDASQSGNPLVGATFFVDHESAAALAARGDPRLNVIADEPGTVRFGSFSWPSVRVAV